MANELTKVATINKPPFVCDCGKALFIRVDKQTGKPEKESYCRRCKRWFVTEISK